MKNIFLLGACGSIGTQTLDVCRQNKIDFKVIGMSVGRNIELSKDLIEEFKPEIVCFRNKVNINLSYNPIIVYGDEGLIDVVKYEKNGNNLVINALVGSSGLKPTIEAIRCYKNIGLANKETLVMAGDIIIPMVKEYNVRLFPIDSEHSAIWQCLQGEDINDVKKIIITASGGAFRDKSISELSNVTVNDALNHPNWKMGPKITIDSATMMNKGFEVIEAHHLFGLPYDKIETIMHRQSIIHSLVEFNDLSIKASLGTPDMRIPIMYAMCYPRHNKFNESGLNLLNHKLTFEELSFDRFKCLRLAYEAGRKGGFYPTILNACNEACVKLFLNGKISFLDIENIIESELYSIKHPNDFNIEEIIALDSFVQKEIYIKYGGKEW